MGLPVSITICTASALNCGLNRRRCSAMDRSSQSRGPVQDPWYTPVPAATAQHRGPARPRPAAADHHVAHSLAAKRTSELARSLGSGSSQATARAADLDDLGPPTRRFGGRLASMQIGVVYPQMELGGDPTAVRRIGTAVQDL